MPDPSKPSRLLMTSLAGIALLAFFIAVAAVEVLPSPSLIHVVLALGVMPLILGAMMYFTPVLTHSRAPALPWLMFPLLALAGGAMAVVFMSWRRELLFIPLLLALFAITTVLGWMLHRARTMLGRPHPGLYWYVWALVCLFLGLTAMLAATLLPDHWAILRRLHLHINLLGFVGLTAYGTLRVLLPTVAGYADPSARECLRRDLYIMVPGTLLIAVGSFRNAWLMWPGLVLWLIPLMRFAAPLVLRWRKHVWGWHRPGTSLGFAAFGLVTVLVSGGVHAVGALSAYSALPLFFYMFLFPLVTGAVSYLLPVWLWPARNNAAYEIAVRRLAWGSGARALVFFVAGGMALAGLPGAVYPAGVVILVFLGQTMGALSARFSAPV